ncbi:MAG: nicotinamide riboside transporter PnuC [Tannerellaceae bacterium]|jgi:nicotinamide mononucleotide transporter|nr:nicotinamide riboside transporter PnuC [Tannerellaceae bacterium]
MGDRLLEYFGVATGLIYLFLEIKQHRAMWIVGILSSLVYVYVFFVSKVYAMMGLNLYNVIISVYGLCQWGLLKRRTDGGMAQDVIVYRHLRWKLAVVIFVALLLINLLVYHILKHYTDSPVPVADAIVTTIGIVATWMLARRIIEHWIFWIVADVLSVGMYYTLKLYPTMFLYFCYTVLAFVGYYTWKKKGVKNGC